MATIASAKNHVNNRSKYQPRTNNVQSNPHLPLTPDYYAFDEMRKRQAGGTPFCGQCGGNKISGHDSSCPTPEQIFPGEQLLETIAQDSQ